MGMVTEFAPAKINLFLHVGEKRADGFHALQSLVVFASAGDTLRFEQSETLSLAVEGPFAHGLETEADNLVLRAARALAAEAGRPAHAKITLTKNLPVSSGIGGGSADAAAALRGLVRLWNVSVPEIRLHALAGQLGSDVPVCVASRTSWMEGRGEGVSAAPGLPSLGIVLVNPGVAVPTGEVFGALRTRRGVDHLKPARWDSKADLIAYLKTTTNDLETPAKEVAPAIADAIAAIARSNGVLLARMSGSGATCFGLFTDKAQAQATARGVAAAHADWWVVAATLEERVS
jgi:4-diphosphocytidyl-2-C-methyl-D-erythritol kinase